MELKAGYKQTEVGVIPEDWKVATLGNLSQILRGGSPRPIEMYLTRNRDGYNWIKIGDVAPNAKYIFATEEKIIKKGRERSRFVHGGDLLLSNSMSFGRPYILQIDGCIHDGWLVIQSYKDTFDTNFLYYLLCSEQTLKQYKAKAAGSGVLNLNKELVASVLLGYPSKPEQKAIASALSDVDALLSSLDALIAKKRDIKTAAMQELLTGNTRLPGFSGEWKENTFKNIAPLQRGYDLPLSKVKKGKYPVIGSNGIIFHHNEFKIKRPGVITGRSGTIGSVFFIEEDYWPHNTTLYVTNFYKNYPKYIYYLYGFYNIEQYSNGSGVPTLNRNDIHDVKIPIPDYAEQAAIAAVLSDMDAEIAALEARRAKVQSLKQGMMQELLTGRTRLLPKGEQHG